jgi:hypothetical protein
MRFERLLEAGPFLRRLGRPHGFPTWRKFEDAARIYRRCEGSFDGLGFVLTAEDPYVFIDLDNCRDPNYAKDPALGAEHVEIADFVHRA